MSWHVLLTFTALYYGTGYLVTVFLALDWLASSRNAAHLFLKPFAWPYTAGRWLVEHFYDWQVGEGDKPWQDTKEGQEWIADMRAAMRQADELAWRRDHGMGS